MQAPALIKDYTELLQHAEVESYFKLLTRDGLNWWFNMEIPHITLHLNAVREHLPAALPHSLRLRFLVETVNPEISGPAMSELYAQVLEENDDELTCAIIGAGIGAVWDSGYDFHRFTIWLERATTLLQQDIPPLARASLLGFVANAQINGEGDLTAARQTCQQQMLAADEAHSNSLRIFYTAVQTYCYIWDGHLTHAEILLEDTNYLCVQDHISIITQVFLHSSYGLFHIINGNAAHGREILERTVSLPFFENMPASIWLLVHANLLFAIANCEDKKALKNIAEKIRQRAIPGQNAFHHSYSHFSLGVAALGLGDAHKALAHAEQAIDRGIAAHSAVTRRMPVLLKGQALADMGQDKEALALFEEWLPRWQKADYNTVAATAAQEAANICLRQGDQTQAIRWYKQAQALMPAGEKLPLFHRPVQFGKQLHTKLSIETESSQSLQPVLIHCFGGLRIEVGDSIIYDRKWRGGRSKTLLKALVVHGGRKIPISLLTDLLWPDAEGDQAYRNIKVLIWRLRRLGLDDGQDPQPWLQLQHGQLSLVNDYCEVDVHLFQTELRRALQRDPLDSLELKTALDRYTGDFLPGDRSETWIIEHRERLRRQYIKGALALSTSVTDPAARIDIEPYLLCALEIDPLDERIYEQLMQIHLETGYPSRALEVYHRAQNALKRGLDIKPGRSLLKLAQQAAGDS